MSHRPLRLYVNGQSVGEIACESFTIRGPDGTIGYDGVTQEPTKCGRRLTYDNLEAAVAAKKKRPNTRVYACANCRRYHLTTKKKKREC
jgi:hypothetical protein